MHRIYAKCAGCAIRIQFASFREYNLNMAASGPEMLCLDCQTLGIVKNKLVCLDPGHNKNSANRSPDGSYYEWEFAQDVCDRAEAMIKRIPGLSSVKTKEADTYPTSLEGRVAVAHDAKADLFLSQHSNAYGSGGWTSPNGFGVYRYPGRDLELAQIGLKWCIELLDMNSRGIREADFYVLRETRMPSLLFETGFHTNREDVEKLKTQEFRQLAAQVLVRTACEFLEVDYVEGENEMSAERHIVRSGDTLYRIARDNNMSVDELLQLNPHIEDPDTIYAEHGGDIVFLEQPNEFEIDYATMNRELILCRLNSAPEEETDELKAQLKVEQEARAKAEEEASEFQSIGREIHTLSAKF